MQENEKSKQCSKCKKTFSIAVQAARLATHFQSIIKPELKTCKFCRDRLKKNRDSPTSVYRKRRNVYLIYKKTKSKKAAVANGQMVANIIYQRNLKISLCVRL